MSDPNANRPSYKETKLGWIPEDWELRRMCEVATGNSGIKTGPFGSQLHKADYVESGVPVIMPFNMRRGLIDPRGIAQITEEKASSLNEQRCKPGDIVFARRGEIGRCAIVREEQDKWLNGTGSLRIRAATDKVSSEFAFFAVCMPRQLHWLKTNAVGQTMLNLSAEIIQNLPLPIPPLPEQRKIAAILRTWDEAIEKLEALRVAKQKRLDGLTHALIFGKLGMNGQRRSWQPTRLSEVTFELTARNTNLAIGYAAVMGVTKARGIVPMREQTIGGDLSRYKRLPPRAFAYNPMRINVGSIAMNDRDEEVLVSPDYVVFGCTENGLAPDFLNHLRKTHWWSHHINIGGSGSVRMRTYYNDLAAMKLPLPAYEEQLEIVAVLNAAQEDVKATEKASKVLTRQKRGLMQKLLTGEWRVKR